MKSSFISAELASYGTNGQDLHGKAQFRETFVSRHNVSLLSHGVKKSIRHQEIELFTVPTLITQETLSSISDFSDARQHNEITNLEASSNPNLAQNRSTPHNSTDYLIDENLKLISGASQDRFEHIYQVCACITVVLIHIW